ncbi:hypothetical protein ACFCX4_24070 [Kitasatospora sp. NPDC056327]|uniref:peptidoglycan-binding domain-containing protein n=1 Tax=Kitasatospora sp. NPDC056327 TaxID=3345785 RepID=UPI0035DEA5FC
MPDQHCPTCGAARSTGCGCLPPDRSLDETTVLPHMEGPPLVRPYVPQALGRIAEAPAGPDAHPADPRGARTGAPGSGPAHPAPEAPGRPAAAGPPPVPPAGAVPVPPVARPSAPPLGPDADAYATTVLPPIVSGPRFPPQPPHGAPPAPPSDQPHEQSPEQSPEQPYDPPGALAAAPGPSVSPAGEELGVFPFTPGGGAGGRAARRAAEQEDDRGPLARRKGLLIAAGAGLLALTVGLAYAVTPSSGPDDRAAPAPTGTLAPAPVMPTTPAPPSPSAPPPAEETPTPTPTRTTARATPTRPATATQPPAAPTAPVTAAPPAAVTDPAATAPPAPPAPSAPATQAPTTAPTTAPPTQSATPTPDPAPTIRTLEYGMEGPDVLALQRKLNVVICWEKVPPTGKYDDRTRLIVTYFQDINVVRGDTRGVYGPNTRTALERRNSC